MKVINYTVNDQGMKEILDFLAENHKKGRAHFNPDMLRAWAKEAEFQLAEGNPASIEIRSWDSVHGVTQEFTISESGIDSETVEIE